MENALIVSNSQEGTQFLTDILSCIPCKEIMTVKICREVSRFSKPFDLVLINSPTQVDSAVSLAKELLRNPTTQVILFLKNEIYDEISLKLEDLPIVTISKPFQKQTLIKYLKLLQGTHLKLKQLQGENEELSQKLHDIKCINRAKFILISNLNMSEVDAHKYIEKQAMNTRTSRIEVAQKILKTYDY